MIIRKGGVLALCTTHFSLKLCNDIVHTNRDEISITNYPVDLDNVDIVWVNLQRNNSEKTFSIE